MFKKLVVAISVLSASVLVISTAQAQNQAGSVNSFYGEVGFSPIDLAGQGGDSKPYAIRLLIGNELHKNLGLDILYTATVAKDSKSGFNGSYNGLGFFLKPKVSVIEGTEVFARLGVVRADSTASSSGSDKGSDIAYGLGVQSNLSKTLYGQVDFMHYYDRDNVYAKGFTVSLGTRF